MRQLCLILSFFYFHSAFGQDDFFGIYRKLDKIADRQVALLDKVRENERDTVKAKVYLRQYKKTLTDSLLSVARGVLNMTFPDISFLGIINKGYAISDFVGAPVIVNYNYLFCQGCLSRIDSTLKWVGNKQVRMIVLFLAPYQKEIEDLKLFEENVTIGFLNDDNEKLISLGLGDNAMYYLNEKRQIEFFDKLHPENPDLAWNNFLKSHHK